MQNEYSPLPVQQQPPIQQEVIDLRANNHDHLVEKLIGLIDRGYTVNAVCPTEYSTIVDGSFSSTRYAVAVTYKPYKPTPWDAIDGQKSAREYNPLNAFNLPSV